MLSRHLSRTVLGCLVGLWITAGGPASAQIVMRHAGSGGADPEWRILGDETYVGLSIGDIQPEQAERLKLADQAGALVEDVEADSPAARAGFRQNDVVIEFDGERVRSARQFRRLVIESAPGRAVKVVVLRDAARETLTATPTRRSWPDVRNRVSSALQRFGFDDPGRIWPRDRARLGVTVQELAPQLAKYFGVEDGVLVTTVEDGSPAQKAGLHAGDVIVSLDGRKVRSASDLIAGLAGKEGKEVTLSIVRDKAPLTIRPRLESGDRPVARRRVVL